MTSPGPHDFRAGPLWLTDVAASLRASYFKADAHLAHESFLRLPQREQARWEVVAGAVTEMLASAWAEGFQDACDETATPYAPEGPADARNPYLRVTCETCQGEHGWYGHHGVWEPCPKCGAA